jgi:beta-mannanase
VRFGHEMNGTWYPWSEARNGNRSGEFAAAWRHVRAIFESVGARNVAWVWSPNAVYPGSLRLEGLYPGNDQVDWVAIDGYNWGTNPLRRNVWQSFADLFGPTYAALGTIAPTKPVMIAETGSTEHGGSKAGWIADAVGVQVPRRFPRIRAFLWFNVNDEGFDWVVETSSAATAAFARAISSGPYASNDFGGIETPLELG